MGVRAIAIAWIAFGAAYGAAEPPPTFARVIAPIVYQFCAPCHHPGGTGPFSLLTYEDVKKRAALIVTVTRSRYMPPWLPEPGHGDFAGELRLSPEQIRHIADWVAAGSPEGSREKAPVAPEFQDGWQLGQPDLVLDAAGSITAPASGPDTFWNFVFTPGLAIPRFVRAVEIRPGNRSAVHHANLFVDRAGAVRRTAAPDASGFPGMDLTIMRNPYDPDGHFLFWKPGALPHVEPDGFAWRLNPGDTLVLNTHLHPVGMSEEVRPSIGLYFTDKPPTHYPLLVQLENDRALRIPAGARDFVVSDDFRVPMAMDVLAIYPHAHYLGKLLEAFATLPDGSRKWLIRIPDWNFSWQSVFYYREPLALPKGAVISMRYHYDNSAANVRNPNHPPRMVTSGDQSTDEMAHLWLELLPRDAADRHLELQEAVMRHRLEKYPHDFLANFNLGVLALARLNVSGAVAMLETAVRIEPNRADAHDLLGTALARVGRVPEAIEQFRLALAERPDFAGARLNLASALLRAGKSEEAIENYRQALAAAPNDKTIRVAVESKARQLEEEGRAKDAAALDRVLQDTPQQ
ncbi:MAG TPA: tetratricopeptide repeat protein [Bryobacteraceae bacterium]|nr:tetratricopeptide repeat protein [Bryobacteraceae bacterium]